MWVLVFDVAEVLFETGDHGVFGFANVMFVAVCACEYVDGVG